jgi:hypothetical protein
MLVVVFAIVSEQYAKIHQVYSGYQKTADADRRKAAEEAGRACVGVSPSALSHCIADQIQTYDKQQATNQDLQAQQDMAFWAFWAVLVSSSSVVVTGLGIWYVRQTLEANRKAVVAAETAVAVTRETSERQLRAYVGTRKIYFQEFSRGRPIAVAIEIENFGQTPAYEYDAVIYLALGRIDGIRSDIIRTSFGEGKTLMPRGVSIVVCKLDLQDVLMAAVETGQMAVCLHGAIRYRDYTNVVRFTDISKLAFGERMKTNSPFIDAQSGNQST